MCSINSCKLDRRNNWETFVACLKKKKFYSFVVDAVKSYLKDIFIADDKSRRMTFLFGSIRLLRHADYPLDVLQSAFVYRFKFIIRLQRSTRWKQHNPDSFFVFTSFTVRNPLR